MENEPTLKKTKVLLIGAEDEENLSIRYLAAVIEKSGHEAEIAPCSNYEQISEVLKIISKYKPDLIGISIAFQSLSDMFFQLVSKIRKFNYKGHIIVGGHFPTFEFRKILDTQSGIDSVGRFEGERTIVELADSIGRKLPLSSVTNLVYRVDNEIHENKSIYEFPVLDKLPFPKRNKKSQMRLGENFATLVASRGCWHSSCLYCCIGAFHSKKEGEKFVLRSPENIAEEIGDLYHSFGVRLFQFHDDNFMLPSKEETRKRFTALKSKIEAKKINTKDIAFLIKARPDTIDDEVASVMKELGVVGVFLGIENASESGLKALIRRVTLEDVCRATSALKKYEIAVTYNLLIFHPTATIEEINKNIGFVRDNIQFPFDFGRAEVVAGSPLERTLIDKKKLIGSWPHWNYVIDDESVEKMFKMNLNTFRGKNSRYSELMHLLIALSYQAYTLKRLHRGPVANELFLKTIELIKEINIFIIEKIEIMRDMSINSASDENVEKFYDELSMNCQKFLELAYNLRNKMKRLSVAENVFQNFAIKDLVQRYTLFRNVFSF